jgi:CH-like domain in sperm protein
MAEIVKFFIPKIVDMHNYPSTANVQKKEANWSTLNTK